MSGFTSLKRLTGTFIDETLALVFQTRCLACGRLAAQPLCADCRVFLSLAPPWCERCGTPRSAVIAECGECRMRGRSSLRTWRSGWWLNDSATALMHRIKFAGCFENLHRFLDTLPPNLEFPGENPRLVVPVPLHPARWMRRGFNQSEIVAAWISKMTGQPWRNGLGKHRDTPAQSTLGRRARLKNLKRGFSWQGPPWPGHRVLLVDDICTTGATLEACARTIRQEWGRDVEINAWTLFRTPRWSIGT
jgi:ComF family protein